MSQFDTGFLLKQTTFHLLNSLEYEINQKENEETILEPQKRPGLKEFRSSQQLCDLWRKTETKSFVCEDAHRPLQNDDHIYSVLQKGHKGHWINQVWGEPIQHLCGKQNG